MLAVRQSPTRSASGGVEPSIELTAEGLWSEVSSRLRGALNETTYRTWFDHVQGLELNDDEFVLAVPNDFTRDWIEGHFIGLISAAVGDATGRERRIQLVVMWRSPRPCLRGAQRDVRSGVRRDRCRARRARR